MSVSYTGIREHYDLLIEENNDPVYDPEPLKSYMDKWDGRVFLEELQLTSEKSVLEIGVGTDVYKRQGQYGWRF